MGERFVDTFIRVLQVDVFAHYRNRHLFLWADDALDKFSPVRQVRLRSLQMQKVANQLVESFGMQ